MKIHIPAFEPMLKANEHLRHGAFDIDLGENVVEIVRCKDCKHYRYYGKTSLPVNGKNTNAGWCMRRARASEEYRMLADDFCSYGERKDGEG